MSFFHDWEGLEPQSIDLLLVSQKVQVFFVPQYWYIVGDYINNVGCNLLFVLIKTILQVSQQIMVHLFIDWICFRVSTHVYNHGERGHLIIMCIPGLALDAHEHDDSNW